MKKPIKEYDIEKLKAELDYVKFYNGLKKYADKMLVDPHMESEESE